MLNCVCHLYDPGMRRHLDEAETGSSASRPRLNQLLAPSGLGCEWDASGTETAEELDTKCSQLTRQRDKMLGPKSSEVEFNCNPVMNHKLQVSSRPYS